MLKFEREAAQLKLEFEQERRALNLRMSRSKEGSFSEQLDLLNKASKCLLSVHFGLTLAFDRSEQIAECRMLLLELSQNSETSDNSRINI